MTDSSSLLDRAKKAVEDAFDETVKGRVDAEFVNIASEDPAQAGLQFKTGLKQIVVAREVALRVVEEVFG